VTGSLNMAWSSPVQIAIALWLLYNQVGGMLTKLHFEYDDDVFEAHHSHVCPLRAAVAMVVGIACMVVLVPVNKMVFSSIIKYRMQMLRLAGTVQHTLRSFVRTLR